MTISTKDVDYMGYKIIVVSSRLNVVLVFLLMGGRLEVVARGQFTMFIFPQMFGT